MPWRIFTWIFIFIAGLLVDLSSGRGVLTIWLLNYKNVKGRTYDGSCCDYAPAGSDTCPDQCDYVMRCIVTGLGRANDHVFLFHRPIKYDSNDISFEEESSQMTQLTILFDEWPTTSSVKMDVFFYDYDDFDHTTVLVDWFETPLQRSVEKGEKQVEVVRGNRQMDKTRLEFKWSVHCFGTNDCLKPPPEWNIWPWAAESKTYSKTNAVSRDHNDSSYYFHNVSKSMTTVNPTQKKTTVKIFNKNINKQWVEADEEFTENDIRSPFSPFKPHTNHGDILNGREKLLDAREHARVIDAEERFDVAPARQANQTRLKKINPIDDYLKPMNAYKKNHKGLNGNLVESMPPIDDPFATDVPVVRDELLKEIYEKVAVELSNDVKKDTTFAPADPSTRLQTIISETEIKTGAIHKNPYIDRNGEHIKLPDVGHSSQKDADGTDHSRNPFYPQAISVDTDKPKNSLDRISISSHLEVESVTDPTKNDESFHKHTEQPKEIAVKRKHRTKSPAIKKWDNNYNWKKHYKEFVLPKQQLSKVKTHSMVPFHGKSKRPIKIQKGEPVSRTGAKTYPKSSLNQLKEARKNSSIEIGYYRQLHTDFITKQNQKRRKENAKVKTSKRITTSRPNINMSAALTTKKAKRIPINVAPINPYAKKRKPYQATLKLDSGFTDWSKDHRTKIPPVNPSAKGPLAAPPGHFKNDIIWSRYTNDAIPNKVKNVIIKPTNTNIDVPNKLKDRSNKLKDKSKIKTTHVDVPDYVENYIDPKSISFSVPVKTVKSDHIENDIVDGNNDIIKPTTTNVGEIDHGTDGTNPTNVNVGVSDYITTSKTSGVDDSHHVKNYIVRYKTNSVPVLDYVNKDIKDSKTTSVPVRDHIKNEIIMSKTNNVDAPDEVQNNTIRTTSVHAPDHIKKDIINSKTTRVNALDNFKKNIIMSNHVDAHDQVKKDIVTSKTTSVAAFDPVEIINSKSINVFPPDKIKYYTIRTKATSVDAFDHAVKDIISSKTTSVPVPDHAVKDIVKSKTTSVPVPDHAKKEIIKTKTNNVVVPDQVTSTDLHQNKVMKSKSRTFSVPDFSRDDTKHPQSKVGIIKVETVVDDDESERNPINGEVTKTTNGVQYVDNIQPLPPPLKSHDKTEKVDRKKKPSDASSDILRNRMSKVFHENNRSSFSVGPFLPEIDMIDRTKPKLMRSTTIHSWYVSDNRLLPELKQSSKRPYDHGNTETPTIITKDREVVEVKPTNVAVDSTKYIQRNSIKEALEKLNPKKSPFHPKRKPINSPTKPHQTIQVTTINKKIKKAGEVFKSKSTTVPKKSTPEPTVDIMQKATTAPFTRATARDHLVVNLPLPPNIKDNVDSGPQIQGSPTAIRPKYSRNPIFNAMLTPVPTKTTKTVHVDSEVKFKTAISDGSRIVPGASFTTKEHVVTSTSGAITQSSVPNRFTPKDRGGLFETFKSLSEMIKKASKKDILKTNDTSSIISTKVLNNVRKSPFSPNPVERKPIITFTSSMSPTSKQKNNDKTTKSRIQTTLKPMANFRHTIAGPTSTSQSPVIVLPMTDVSRTTTVSQMNIFEFLPNAIKEIYFGKTKQPILGIHNQIHTTASALETVRSKPTIGGASDPDTPEYAIKQNVRVNQNNQHLGPFAKDPENTRSKDLTILDSLSNQVDLLKNDGNQNPYIPVVPTTGKKEENLNYVYQDPKTKSKGTNFLFDNPNSHPKNPRNTFKRPLKPTTRYRRPKFPALPSHRYFAYTRLGPAEAFTTTPVTTKRQQRFKLPGLPTHRYFAYTRKDTPTTTDKPNKNSFGSFKGHGKVKLVSNEKTRKPTLGFENTIPKHTTKTRFPNSAASKTFNPLNYFRSKTPSPRSPTQIGVRKSEGSKDHQTRVTKIERVMPPGEQEDLSRLSRTSLPIATEQLNTRHSTRTTKSASTDIIHGMREHLYSTKSVNKIGKTFLDDDIKQQKSPNATNAINDTRKQSVAAETTEAPRRTKIIDENTAIPVTTQGQSLLIRNSNLTTDKILIRTNASRPRSTVYGNAGETSVETDKKVNITSDIFRWIYDLSKSLPEKNKTVSKTNNTVNFEAHNIKVNDTSSNVVNTKEPKILSPFFNMFFNLTNIIEPKTNITIDRTNHVFASGGPPLSVEEVTLSDGSPTRFESTNHGLPSQTGDIWYNGVNVLTNKENEGIKRNIKQSIPPRNTQPESLENDRRKVFSTNKAQSTLKSRVTSEETSTRQLEPKKVRTTKSMPRTQTTSESGKNGSKSSESVTLKSPNITNETLATITTKVLLTHTDEQLTTSSSTAHGGTTATKETTTPKKIQLTIPPWLKITTPLLPIVDKVTSISTQPTTTTEELPKTTTMHTKKLTTKKPKSIKDKISKTLTTAKHQKPTTKTPVTKKPTKPSTKKPTTTKKPTKPTTKKPTTTKKPKKQTTKKPTTKKPKKPTTKKPTTKKPKKATTKKPGTKTTDAEPGTTISPKKNTTSTTEKTRKPVNITINMDPISNDGPRIIIPNGGLFIPQPRDYNSSSYGYPGGSARLQVRKMNFKTVFNRYWPAILGLTVGTVFLVAAVLTSVACRQQRLYIRRTGWTDMPHHVSEPPDTSEYSSAASLVSDATRSSISFQ